MTGQLTPREQFEARFGAIDDDDWQWLKEFCARYYIPSGHVALEKFVLRLSDDAEEASIVHNLGSTDVVVSAYDPQGNPNRFVTRSIVDANRVVVSFGCTMLAGSSVVVRGA